MMRKFLARVYEVLWRAGSTYLTSTYKQKFKRKFKGKTDLGIIEKIAKTNRLIAIVGKALQKLSGE